MKRILSVILVILLAFSVTAPAFAESVYTGDIRQEDTPDANLRYVNLGASNSNGYGLHGYLTEDMYADPNSRPQIDDGPGISGLNMKPEGCYADLLADYYESLGYTVDFKQLAQSTMRVEDLRLLIDEDFSADDYTKWRFYDPQESGRWWNGILDELRDYYEYCISNADIITYDMGMNNFGTFIMLNTVKNKFNLDMYRVLDEKYADIYYSLRDKLMDVLLSAAGDALSEDDLGGLAAMPDTMAYALIGYCVNFDATIARIREMNPDAKLVVVNIQNVMDGIVLSLKGIELPLGAVFGSFVELANTYMELLSPYKDQYLMADAGANGRVDFFMDEIMYEYEGNMAPMTDRDVRDCLDVYDSSMPTYLRFRLAAEMLIQSGDYTRAQYNNDMDFSYKLDELEAQARAKFGAVYENALETAYAAVSSLYKVTLLESPLKADMLLESVLDGTLDTDRFERDFYSGIKGMIGKVAQMAYNGEQYGTDELNEDIATILSDEAMRSVCEVLLRSTLGNTFFAHPSRKGHQEVCSAILTALKNDTKPEEVFKDTVKKINNTVFEESLKLGTNFTYLFLEKLADAFGLDENTLELLSYMLPGRKDAAEILIALIGVGSERNIGIIGDCAADAAAEAGDYAAVHSLKKVGARAASFFTRGNIEYYYCTDCGRCFTDAMGRNEISCRDVVIDRLGLSELIQYIFGLFERITHLTVPGGIRFGA